MPGLLVPWPEEGWHSAQELSRALVMVENNESTLSPGFFTIYLLRSQPRPPRGQFSQISVPLLVHKQTCIRTHIYVHTQTCIHTLTHICRRLLPCTHKRIYTYICAHKHTYTHAHTNIYSHTCIHTHTYARSHAHLAQDPNTSFIPLIFLHKL